MYLVAIAWMYVVLMMAVAEALSSQGTVLGALFTLLLYGLLPLGVVLYIMGTPMRRRQRLAQADETAEAVAEVKADTATDAAAAHGAPVPNLAAAPLPTPLAQPATWAVPAALSAPDGRRVAPGDSVAPERKEV